MAKWLFAAILCLIRKKQHTRNYISRVALLPCVDFYVMDSSPDAAVIDYTRQKEIESQVAVSHKMFQFTLQQQKYYSRTTYYHTVRLIATRRELLRQTLTF